MASNLIRILLASSLVFAAAKSLGSEERRITEIFDILPKCHITGTGLSCPMDEEDPREAQIFPSMLAELGHSAVDARSEVKEFLLADNWIPSGTSSYPISESSVYKIDVFRKDTKSSSIVISARAATVKEIRKLNWKQFRALQSNFGCWLIRLNQPKYLFDHFDKPIEGFSPRFSERLRDFWQEVTKTAAFEQFAALPDVKKNTSPSC